jgi:hypothetical protein
MVKMNNPWELKINDTREIDNLYTFLIFCEDETSEYEYFKFFETDKIKINIFQNQKNSIENVIKAITYCNNNGIIDCNNNVIEGFEIWCVYDRDTFIDDPNFEETKTKFNIASSTADLHKINLAWSNDSFELWVLLHLKEITDLNDYLHRDNYYEFLENYFKNKENKNERLELILSHSTFTYKRDMKKRKNFIEVVRNEILPYTEIAIERSKNLASIHSHKEDLTNWCPCTLVHNLVERLLNTGRKELPVLK